MTEEKVLKVEIIEKMDSYGDVVFSQKIVVPEQPSIRFRVSNLCECPEDAIIGRDLFDAHDFIKVLEKGMELAKLGYTSIKQVTVLGVSD